MDQLTRTLDNHEAKNIILLFVTLWYDLTPVDLVNGTANSRNVYAMETLCNALYTIVHPTKPSPTTWARPVTIHNTLWFNDIVWFDARGANRSIWIVDSTTLWQRHMSLYILIPQRRLPASIMSWELSIEKYCLMSARFLQATEKGCWPRDATRYPVSAYITINIGFVYPRCMKYGVS